MSGTPVGVGVAAAVAVSRPLGEAQVGAGEQPGRGEDQRDAERQFDRVLDVGAVTQGWPMSAPQNAVGTEPMHSHLTRSRLTVPAPQVHESRRPAS